MILSKRLNLAIALFLAFWQGASTARLEWQQPPNISITCLSKDSALIRCYRDLPAGRYVMTVGGAETDGAFKAERGAVYSLWQDGVVSKATIRGVVFLPVAKG